MSTITSTQPSRALSIIAGVGNTVDIPFPGEIKASGTSGVVVLANNLIVTGLGANFFTDRNIQPGDIVYNTTGNLTATVVRVVSGLQLELSSNAFPAAGASFRIYSSNVTPALIYNSQANNTVTVITEGGNTQQFFNLPVGILPVRVTRITAASVLGAGVFVAVW